MQYFFTLLEANRRSLIFSGFLRIVKSFGVKNLYQRFLKKRIVENFFYELFVPDSNSGVIKALVILLAFRVVCALLVVSFGDKLG